MDAADSGTNAEFRGLVALSPTVVWASGTRGRVARTTDGGTTWTVDSIPGASGLDFRDIDARSADARLGDERRARRAGSGADLPHGRRRALDQAVRDDADAASSSTRSRSGTTSTASR